jgi:hypothetical protein
VRPRDRIRLGLEHQGALEQRLGRASALEARADQGCEPLALRCAGEQRREFGVGVVVRWQAGDRLADRLEHVAVSFGVDLGQRVASVAMQEASGVGDALVEQRLTLQPVLVSLGGRVGELGLGRFCSRLMP